MYIYQWNTLKKKKKKEVLFFFFLFGGLELYLLSFVSVHSARVCTNKGGGGF